MLFLSVFFIFYCSGLSYVFLSLGISFLLVYLSLLGLNSFKDFFSYGNMSIYECGYTEINSMYNFYTIQFFLVALSFMLFDMEIVLVLPLVYLSSFGFLSLFLSMAFLGVLMLGLMYEFQFDVFKW